MPTADGKQAEYKLVLVLRQVGRVMQVHPLVRDGLGLIAQSLASAFVRGRIGGR